MDEQDELEIAVSSADDDSEAEHTTLPEDTAHGLALSSSEGEQGPAPVASFQRPRLGEMGRVATLG